MKVCIDPGHSGPFEPGACAGGVTEAAITLAISKLSGEILDLFGHEVIYTRQGDIETDDLAFRAQLANEKNANVFVSIHCNSAESADAKGIETYSYPSSVQGKNLAEKIQGVLPDCTSMKNRGVKEADFAVLRLTTMPAVLVECGFITSAEDREMLTDNRK